MAIEEPRASVTGRSAIALLAGLGAAETGFITANKLWGVGDISGLCTATGSSCADVLNGPWASVGGVPLALVGFAAYATVAVLAALPPSAAGGLGAASEEGGVSGDSVLVFGSGALAAFSACLLLLLGLVIQQSCALCYGSAAISVAIFGIAWRTPLLEDKAAQAKVAAIGGAASLAAAATLYFVVGAQTPSLGASAGFESTAPPRVRSKSSARAVELAETLKSRNARLYGAFWCSHCADQKETLGAEAAAIMPYYECDAEGQNSKRDECQKVGVRGYPTWQLDGKLYSGERSLDDLEAILAGVARADTVEAK